jgi:hypothetical protein
MFLIHGFPFPLPATANFELEFMNQDFFLPGGIPLVKYISRD